MILTPRKRPGRNARWAAAGILAATCLALPWLRVSVAAPGDDLPALKDSRGATRQIPKAELPEDIQKARRELASRLLEQARAEYRSKRFDLCREYLFQAHRLGGLGDEVFVLDAEVGVLSLMGSVQQNEVYRAGKSGSAPVMLRWIEGRFGPLPRESVRFWTDVDEGLLVQPVEKLQEIRKVFLRRPEKKRQLLIEFRVVQIDPEAVTRCLAEVGVEAPKAAGPLTAKLDAAQSRRFERFVNSEDGVVVINGPMLTTNSDQLATVEISTEEAFIEKIKASR